MMRDDAIFIFSESTIRPRIVICLFATFVAEPLSFLLTLLLLLLLASLAHWLLGEGSVHSRRRSGSGMCDSGRACAPPLHNSQVFSRLRLLALVALRGLELLLALRLSTVPERNQILEGLGRGVCPSVRPPVGPPPSLSVRPSVRF